MVLLHIHSFGHFGLVWGRVWIFDWTILQDIRVSAAHSKSTIRLTLDTDDYRFAHRKPDAAENGIAISLGQKRIDRGPQEVTRPIMRIGVGSPLGGPATARLRLVGRALRRRALCRRLAAGAAGTLRSGSRFRLARRLGFPLCSLGHVFSLSFAQLKSAQKTNHNYFEEFKLCPND